MLIGFKDGGDNVNDFVKDLFIDNTTKSVCILIRLTPTQKKVLQQMCKEKGISVSRFILELVQQQYEIFITCEHDDLPF